jgi:hypothetical protein
MRLGHVGNTRGQAAAFDAVMFLAILLVASALVLGVSTHLKQAEDVSEFDDLYTLASRTSNALLGSTVPNASYVDVEGDVIVSKDISVLDMMVEELLLIQAGVPVSSFEGPGRYNHRIAQTLSSLVEEDRFQFELYGRYMDASVSIGEGSGQGDKAAKLTEIFPPGVTQPIQITLSVWPC